MSIFRGISILARKRFATSQRPESRRLSVAYVYVAHTHTRTHVHTYARTRTHDEKRMDRRAGAARVLRSLVRSSNEESSRVPARRSARSVSTRLAIEQHRKRAGERCATTTGSFFPPRLFASRAPKETIRYVELTAIDDDRPPGILRRRRETCKRTILRSWSSKFTPRYCSSIHI